MQREDFDPNEKAKIHAFLVAARFLVQKTIDTLSKSRPYDYYFMEFEAGHAANTIGIRGPEQWSEVQRCEALFKLQEFLKKDVHSRNDINNKLQELKEYLDPKIYSELSTALKSLNKLVSPTSSTSMLKKMDVKPEELKERRQTRAPAPLPSEPAKKIRAPAPLPTTDIKDQIDKDKKFRR